MAAEKELERLIVRLVGDAESYQKMLAEARSAAASADQSIGKSVKNIEENTKALSQAGMFSVMMVGRDLAQMFGGLSQKIVDSSAAYEQTTVSFEAMLGSATLAKSTLSDLVQFAAKTPFEMPTLEAATKMLLQYGVSANEVLPILRSIGDVTGGADPNKVMQMSYAFGQMRASGRLMGQDLLQMINAGFNPLREIAKVTGKSVSMLKDEMEKGRITAEMVGKAFDAASKRLNLMEKQSSTLTGRISTLRDNYGIFLRHIGDETAPMVNLAVDALAKLVAQLDKLPQGAKVTVGGLAYVGAGVGQVVEKAGMFSFAVSSLLAGLKSIGPYLLKFGSAVAAPLAIFIQGYMIATRAADWINGVAEAEKKAEEQGKALTKQVEGYNVATKEKIDLLKKVAPAFADSTAKGLIESAELEAFHLQMRYNALKNAVADQGWVQRTIGTPSIDEAQRVMKELESKIAAAQARLKGFQDTVDMMPKPISTFKDSMAELNKQFNALLLKAKSPIEQAVAAAEAAAAAQGNVLTPDERMDIRAAARRNEDQKALQEFNKDIEAFIREQEQSTLALRMNSDELKFHKLWMEANGDATKQASLDTARAAMETAKIEKDAYELKKEAKRIIEDNQPASAKLAKVKADLDDQLSRGNITQKEYNALLEDARKKLVQVTKASHEAAAGAMAYGSAAHLAELERINIWDTSTAQPRARLPQPAPPVPGFDPIKVFGVPGPTDTRIDASQSLDRLVAIAEKYWGKGTNITLEPAALS